MIKFRQFRQNSTINDAIQLGEEMSAKGQKGLSIDLKRVKTKDLGFLSSFPSITHLAIGGEFTVETVPVMPNVRYLCILKTEIRDFSFLEGMMNIEVLDLRFCRPANLNKIRLSPFLKALSALRIKTSDSWSFIENLRYLEWLKFENCPSIVNFPSFRHLSKLKRAVFIDLENLRSLKSVAESPSIEDLFVFGKNQLTESSFDDFIGHSSLKMIFPDLTNTESFESVCKKFTGKVTQGYYGLPVQFFELTYGDRLKLRLR